MKLKKQSNKGNVNIFWYDQDGNAGSKLNSSLEFARNFAAMALEVLSYQRVWFEYKGRTEFYRENDNESRIRAEKAGAEFEMEVSE